VSLRRAPALILLLAVAAMPAGAEAATKTVTVTADRVISIENDPNNTGNCSTIVFYEWSDVPGTTSATVNYLRNGEPRSETRAAPFDDALTDQKPPRYAPPGRHRILVGWSYGSGPTKPNYGCRDRHGPVYEQALAPTATAVLTVETQGDTPACTSAKRTLAERTKAVRKIKRQLANASKESTKRQLRSKLQNVKRSKKRAQTAVKERC
jgi:hypothetical protein